MTLKRLQSNDRILSQLQDNMDQALSPLQAAPLTGGNLVVGQALTSGQDNLVAHGLGQAPTKWILARQDTNTTVWEATTTALGGVSANDRFINLKCGTSCTVSVWFGT